MQTYLMKAKLDDMHLFPFNKTLRALNIIYFIHKQADLNWLCSIINIISEPCNLVQFVHSCE